MLDSAYNWPAAASLERVADKKVVKALDRRDPARGIGLLKAAKLLWGQAEDLCLIRNISATGLIAEVYFPVTRGTRVLVLIAEDYPLVGRVSWTSGARTGITFDTEVDVAALMAAFSSLSNGLRPRMPRISVDAWARLRVGARLFSVRVCDISQGGARIRVQGLNTSGQEGVLAAEGFRPVQGVVRWCHDLQAGLSFNHPLGLRELMGWLRSGTDERAA